ncbi:hypothetical protein ABIF91_003493 [Bradyrhizobium sp. USDA 241]
MMTMPEIERCLRQLRLSGVRDTLQTRVLQAQGANQPFLETFSLILQDELDRRQSRLIERRYQQSGLDEKLTLAERAGPGCLDSAPLDLSGFLPGYAERGALRFCRCVGRA